MLQFESRRVGFIHYTSNCATPGQPNKNFVTRACFFHGIPFQNKYYERDFWHMRNKDDRRRKKLGLRKTSFFSARDIRLDKQESSKLRIISRQLYQSISIDRRHVARSCLVRDRLDCHAQNGYITSTNNKQTTDEG